MNRNREEAFNHWWLFIAKEDGRMTPSAIWDAACDWMKDEIIWRVEHAIEKAADESRDGES